MSTSTTTTTTTKATTTTKTSTTSTHQTTTATQSNASSTTITTTPIRTTSSFTSPTPIDSIFPDNTQCSKIHKKVQKIFEISFHKILQNSTLWGDSSGAPYTVFYSRANSNIKNSKEVDTDGPADWWNNFQKYLFLSFRYIWTTTINTFEIALFSILEHCVYCNKVRNQQTTAA